MLACLGGSVLISHLQTAGQHIPQGPQELRTLAGHKLDDTVAPPLDLLFLGTLLGNASGTLPDPEQDVFWGVSTHQSDLRYSTLSASPSGWCFLHRF